MINCLDCTETSLRANPERSYTTRQMQKHLEYEYDFTWSLSEVRFALKNLRDRGIATRSREGRLAFRYTLTRS